MQSLPLVEVLRHCVNIVVLADNFKVYVLVTIANLSLSLLNTYKHAHVAVNASATGVLKVVVSPQTNEAAYEMTQTSISPPFSDNRTGVVLGESTLKSSVDLLMCEVEHVGTSSSMPTFQWIRNGVTLVEDANHIVTLMPSGLANTLQVDNFAQSDTGEYQCIITDTDTDAEVITTVPFRLDTGKLFIIGNIILFKSNFFDYYNADINTDIGGRPTSTLILERVTPDPIFIRPPEKLVIEVKASGRFLNVVWQKNGVVFQPMEQEVSNHFEIYIREQTDASDLTLYEISLLPVLIGNQANRPLDLVYNVIEPGKVLKTLIIIITIILIL